jgi:hypothetical protein
MRASKTCLAKSKASPLIVRKGEDLQEDLRASWGDLRALDGDVLAGGGKYGQEAWLGGCGGITLNGHDEGGGVLEEESVGYAIERASWGVDLAEIERAKGIKGAKAPGVVFRAGYATSGSCEASADHGEFRRNGEGGGKVAGCDTRFADQVELRGVPGGDEEHGDAV